MWLDYFYWVIATTLVIRKYFCSSSIWNVVIFKHGKWACQQLNETCYVSSSCHCRNPTQLLLFAQIQKEIHMQEGLCIYTHMHTTKFYFKSCLFMLKFAGEENCRPLLFKYQLDHPSSCDVLVGQRWNLHERACDPGSLCFIYGRVEWEGSSLWL